MNDVVIALCVTVGLSVVISVVEIVFRSRTRLRYCLGGSWLLYVTILAIGNGSTTLLAVTLVDTAGDFELPGPDWFWYAFLGVFAFEGVLQNTNVTVFGKGVLSIEDWISKARDNAEVAANRSQTTADHRRSQALAKQLVALPEAKLNAYVLQHLGADVLQELNAMVAQTGADPCLTKALALAYETPDQAEAIV